jgi:steroid 5-alpha reductase family enzyme
MQWNVLLVTAVTVVCMVIAVWGLSVKIRDASIVDIFWGFGFVVIAWVTRATATGNSTRQWILVACTTLWGLRLSAYLFWRNHGKGEDFRYRAMRKKHGAAFAAKSLYTVFLLQGLLMWIVSLPVQTGQMYVSPNGLGAYGVFGVGLFAFGLAFETIGDFQLARFKANPESAGKVMDRGLWGWTRHPNYFGDYCVWWGLFFIAVRGGWGVVPSAIGPMVMSILLTRVSGVPMLEHTMAQRRPGYVEYVARTSPFFPRRPKRAAE